MGMPPSLSSARRSSLQDVIELIEPGEAGEVIWRSRKAPVDADKQVSASVIIHPSLLGKQPLEFVVRST